MIRKMSVGILAILISCLLVSPSLAKDPKKEKKAKTVKEVKTIKVEKKIKAPKVEKPGKGPSGPAGKSNIGHLYLYEKEPGEDRTEPWLIVEGGMWGKMKYNLSGPTFDFVFNGHGLPIGQEFTLIYYPDPWPGNGLICLGSGIVVEDGILGTDEGSGNIHIKGSVDTGSLPIESDENDGAKIFLVPSGDVDCENQLMIGWSGDDANLYEGALIYFTDTDEDE